MAEIQVHQAELQLTTVRLSKAVFKQLRLLNWQDIAPLVRGDDIARENVVGWVHGSVTGDDFKQWLIVRIAEGQYGRYDAMQGTCAKFPQIYLT